MPLALPGQTFARVMFRGYQPIERVVVVVVFVRSEGIAVFIHIVVTILFREGSKGGYVSHALMEGLRWRRSRKG